MGRVDKGVKCSVAGCENPAVRSLDSERVSKAGLHVGGSRRAYLCRVHYKEMKKKSRKDRLLERWRMMR
ncbi:MAG: hypothetical protein ACUVTM_01780 [Candidatus Bathyarchaeia archaeon]